MNHQERNKFVDISESAFNKSKLLIYESESKLIYGLEELQTIILPQMTLTKVCKWTISVFYHKMQHKGMFKNTKSFSL